jgi:hypothetical protein
MVPYHFAEMIQFVAGMLGHGLQSFKEVTDSITVRFTVENYAHIH